MKRTWIMGILNVTPDSFSDGGQYLNLDDAVHHGLRMAEQGADIIDIGGESTRPFAKKVSNAEEIKRVIPVIQALSVRCSVPISIDTTKAEVARQAIKAGAVIVNDISSLQFDPEMGRVVAENQVRVILMHIQGTPQDMQTKPNYNNLMKEVKQFLEHVVQRALDQGISRHKIIIDPGIGFGKTPDHNLILLQKLDYFKSLDLPILIGTSRKSFLKVLLQDQKADYDLATQASISAAILNGADFVRVHDIPSARITTTIIDAIKNVR